MRKNLRARKLAGRLLILCRDEEGRISAERVDAVLAALRKNPPRDYRAVLQFLSFLAEREVAASTARVVSGKELSPDSIERIRSTFSEKYARSIDVENREDPSLIAGTRVQVGDDVYEISISSRLASIAS